MTDVATIAETASRIPDPQARAAYLDTACGGDREILARVAAILEADSTGDHWPETAHPVGATPADTPMTIDHTPRESAEETLDAHRATPAEGEATVSVGGQGRGARPAGPRPISEGPGSWIGPYRLVERVGEGGMGSVFLAEQVEPVRRQVALKIIKPGMDSEQVVARFEAERQALAMMEHPNIARVLDAGTTDTGRPFFVMELVRGLPITQFCDQRGLTPRQRLELIVPVCQAVQHAHQKGVIHRDIKPSNVLVAEIDGHAIPKVIDFGIAKATDQKLTERSLFTQVGAVVGTPEYMSPEQAGLGSGDIDTRADVYSLGVLLYELLTGTTPIERARLRQAGWAEMLRVIREEEPPTPSSRLTGQHPSLPSASAVRGTEPARLARLVRGELDWIVMKCLEKERERRYETANALVRDIQRYLADEPVEAGPPSRVYRLQKFARKNRALLTTAAAIAAILCVATVVSSALAYWAIHQRNRAVAAEGLAVEATGKERSARMLAESRLGQLEKATLLLGSVFEDLSADQIDQQGKSLRVVLGDRLQKTADELDGEAIGDPITMAQVQQVLGLSLLSMGYAEPARRSLDRAGEIYRRELGEDHLESLLTRGNIARALHDLGRHAEAIARFETIAPLLERNPDVADRDRLRLLGTFGNTLAAANHVERALPILERVLQESAQSLGDEDPDTLTSRNDLAATYRVANQVEKSIPLMERIVQDKRDRLGPDDPGTLASQSNLGDLYHAAGRWNDAIGIQEPTTRSLAEVLGPDHPTTLTCRGNLAASYLQAGRTAEAVAILEKVVAHMTRRLGSSHPETLNMQGNLAMGYKRLGRTREAIAVNRLVLAAMETQLGRDHPRVLASRNNLAAALTRAGRPDEAIPLLETNLLMVRRAFGAAHPNTVGTEVKLLNLYEALDRWADAERLLREIVRGSGADLAKRVTYIQELAEVLQRQEKWAEAVPLLRECLRIREDRGDASWSTDVVRSALGLALARLKNFDEAESLIVVAYKNIDAHRGQIPATSRSRIADASRAGVVLYESMGNLDEARRWRRRLDDDIFPAEPFAR